MVELSNWRMKKTLKRYLRSTGRRFRIEKAILFGSRARADYLLDSDVDLLLVSEDFEGMPFRKRCGELLRHWPGPVDLEVLGYTPAEFRKMKKRLGIVAQAVKEGVIVG